jgi:hypothetical protein
LEQKSRVMGWKLLFIVGLIGGTLWYMGYGPADLKQAAASASDSTASAISPYSANDDWGSGS